MYDIGSMLDFTAKMDPYVIFTVKTQEKTSTVAQGIVRSSHLSFFLHLPINPFVFNFWMFNYGLKLAWCAVVNQL